MHLRSLIRCGVASIAAVAIEFALLTFFVSVCHLFYLCASVLAGLVYFVVNFAMNRRWAFRASGCVWRHLIRHAFVAGVGMGLGTTLLWLFVGQISLPYQVGWLMAGTVGFFGWTYPLHRWFTYREAPVAVSSGA